MALNLTQKSDLDLLCMLSCHSEQEQEDKRSLVAVIKVHATQGRVFWCSCDISLIVLYVRINKTHVVIQQLKGKEIELRNWTNICLMFSEIPKVTEWF